MSRRISKDNGLSKKMKLQNKSGSKSGLEDFDDEILRLFNKNVCTAIDRISEIGSPRENEQIRIITKRAFNAIEFIKFILEKEQIEETYICVYSIDYKTGVIVDNLAKQGELGNVTFLISNLKNSAYRQKDALVRERFIKNKKIKLVFAGSHAKLILCKTKENFYVIEGSMNLSPNSRIEQCLFENSEQVYNFHKNWIDRVDEIATEKELAIYNQDGQLEKGSNKFKQYNQNGKG